MSSLPGVVLHPASDTSSVYTPEYTPAPTPQPEARASTQSPIAMGESKQSTGSGEPAQDNSHTEVPPSEEGKGKDGKDVQLSGTSATEHKVPVRCKKTKAKTAKTKAKAKAKAKAKSRKTKKHRRSTSSSSSDSSSNSDDNDSDACNSDASSDTSSSSESESEEETDMSSSSSSSSSSSEEETQRSKRKSKKGGSSKNKAKKSSRKSRRKEVSSSDDSDSEDDSPSSTTTEEGQQQQQQQLQQLQQQQQQQQKRNKKNNKKRNRRRRRDEPDSMSEADDEEDVLAKAQEYLKSRGLKAKGLKATKKAIMKNDSDDSDDGGRRSTRKGSKRSKKDKETKKGDGKRPQFFRGDELWDNENHQFEVKPTKSRNKKENANEYIFTVKRKFDWEGKYEYTVVDIHAKPLRDCLQKIMERCKSVSLAEDEPTLDPDMLFLYLEDIREYRKQLKANLESEQKLKKKTKKIIKLKLDQLKCMLKYLDKDYASTKSTLYPMLKEGVITFELLWTLFRSDTIVYTPTYKNESEPRAFKVEYCMKEQSFTKGVWYEISGKYFDFDGKTFGLGGVQAEIDSFQGVRKINSLACFPMKYHNKCDELSKQLVERGKKFVSLAGMQYKFLKGMAFMKRRGAIVKINVNGRIMCDPATFRRINPNYPISNVKKEDPDLLSDCSDSECESDKEAPAAQADACTCPDCLALDPNAFAQQRERDDTPKMRWKRVRDPKSKAYDYVQVPVDDNGVEIRNPDQPQGNAGRDLEALPRGEKKKGNNDNDDDDDDDEAPGKQETFSEEELLIASPVILGFAFSEKLWLELSVSGVQEIQWNEGAFDSLVLPDDQKSIIQALVTAHAAEAKADSRAEAAGEAAGKIPGGHQNIDDVIQGKGKGLVAVLHGSPGTGKTLTAEGIAELRRCPLYCVSAGELGTNPRELEAELTKILDVAHVWGAVLLLDEADVFLEARTAQDIHRNALVSIFLRLLEYFQGILFLTTNRVASFDEAFQSRIHIALRYQELDHRARRKVWNMFLARVRALPGADVADFAAPDLDRLARKLLNGRQIKNAVRSAQALAVNERKALSMAHVEKVLDVAASFERDLKGGTGYDDAMRSYT